MSTTKPGKDRSTEQDPNEEAPACYASPPCYAHEVDPTYFGVVDPIGRDELVSFLNTLLEAERAGAKTIAFYLEGASPGSIRDALQAVGRDEGRYAALLSRLVREQGAEPSAVTGSFFDKAKAIASITDRLAFLNRGQGWVARKLAEILPRIADAEMRAALDEMHKTHVENIRRCEALL